MFVVRTEQDLAKVVEGASNAPLITVDTETVDYGMPDTRLVGISLCYDGKTGVYIPVKHQEPGQLPLELVLQRLKPVLQDNRKQLLMHYAPYDFNVLKAAGLITTENIVDTLTASWLLDTESEHGLKSLVQRYFGYKMIELKEIAPKEKHPRTGLDLYRPDRMPVKLFAKYAADDALWTHRLWSEKLKKPVEDEFGKLFYDLELPFNLVLADMMWNGVYVDVPMLTKLGEEVRVALDQAEKAVYEARPGGNPFNLNSSQQLARVLYEEVGIEPLGERGKNGQYSTAEPNLQQYAKKHEIARRLLTWREYDKLYSTYIEGMLSFLGADHRLRSRFGLVSTGRLSSSKPNLQNIPRPDNDSFGIRRAFIASEGKQLIVADYSQIELRILAHLSRDPKMMAAFQEGYDLHSATAKFLFDLGCPVDQVKNLFGHERSIAKTINFGMSYGAGAGKVSEAAGVSMDKARMILDRYFSEYVRLSNYFDWVIEKAHKEGRVRTLAGRYRYLPDARSKNKETRAKAERKARNSPIQGGARDVIAIAMRNLRRRIREEGEEERVKITLQVHDELIFEADQDIAQDAARMVKEEMEKAVTLRVPIEADVGVGDRWTEAKG